jgi:polyisoprenoid-binding protein YceI
MNKKTTALLLGLALLPGWASAGRTYEIDPQHSGVTFRVQHLVISKVTGHFDKFSGSIEYEKGKPKTWKADAAIDAASINTNVEARDKHLRSADFLDVEKFPQIAFKSTKVVAGKGETARLYGDLTIHGVTKPVVLALEIGGTAKDPWGNDRLGATATTKISRKDFGLTWNKALETGGVMVGDELEITLEVEGIAKKDAAGEQAARK